MNNIRKAFISVILIWGVLFLVVKYKLDSDYNQSENEVRRGIIHRNKNLKAHIQVANDYQVSPFSITLKRSKNRIRDTTEYVNQMHTFPFGDYVQATDLTHFGPLEVLNEATLSPNSEDPPPSPDPPMNYNNYIIITYLFEGEIYLTNDISGVKRQFAIPETMSPKTIIVQGGVFQFGIRNPSLFYPAKYIQFWLSPTTLLMEDSSDRYGSKTSIIRPPHLRQHHQSYNDLFSADASKIEVLKKVIKLSSQENNYMGDLFPLSNSDNGIIENMESLSRVKIMRFLLGTGETVEILFEKHSTKVICHLPTIPNNSIEYIDSTDAVDESFPENSNGNNMKDSSRENSINAKRLLSGDTLFVQIARNHVHMNSKLSNITGNAFVEKLYDMDSDSDSHTHRMQLKGGYQAKASLKNEVICLKII